ncbi:glycoside hydrolase family 27 protein [Lewinella sp. IMCC34183]|uniref:glycoside hydrolase family 27 protein n=1 Tax=Lewinella sp. IMCC34183 TaxID=2248762 RepID=UPI000E2322B8|nr:glycoside hydrolase family 27 protein [Lewinella sp. IMCC34183]
MRILSLFLLLLLLACGDGRDTASADVATPSSPSADTTFRAWAATPPLGWNSWDSYGPTVREDEVKANADYMAANLKEFGWEYVVVDIRWFVENTKRHGYNQTDPIYVLDEYGRYLPATNRFPSAADGNGFTALADYVHEKGLKFGIHLMRGVPTEAVERKLPILGADGITADQIYTTDEQCQWLRDNYTIVADQPGAQEYYNSIMDLYASWGVDFIKIDDLSAPIYHKEEIELIRKAIDQTGRAMVLSTSPGPTPVEYAEHVSNHANMWRMVNDVWDNWGDIDNLMSVTEGWYDYIGGGTWPDCDMIPLGRLSIRGERGDDRMANLSQDEQYTLMSLFTIFRSPLFFGGDLPSNDDFTNSLLTNEAVLKMHAEATGVRLLLLEDDRMAITSRHPTDGTVYLALFNRSDEAETQVQVSLEELGLLGSVAVTDLWTGESLGEATTTFGRTFGPHASGLYQLGTAN